MLSTEEKMVYGKLYDIVDKNIAKTNGNMVASKEVFLLDAELEPQKTNMELLKHVTPRDIVHASYVAILRRMPDQAALQYWTSTQMLKRKDYCKVVIRSLVDSVERTMKGIELYNLQALGIKQSKLEKIKQLMAPFMNWLYRIYRLLPKSWKTVIRKVLR